MKKVVSAVLTFAMIITTFVVPVTVTSAKTTAKKVPATYVATNRSYPVKNGSVFCFDQGKLQYKTKQGKTKTLAKFSDEYTCQYYVRRNIVYYNTNSGTSSYLMQVGLNGKNKKILYKKKNEDIMLIGGYGSSVIFQCDNNICKYKDGKVTTLTKYTDGCVILPTTQIFNGKLYYNNKSYDLETKKVKSFKAENVYSTKNYMYFVTPNKTLKRLDKSGKIKALATKIDSLYFARGETVVYSKLDSNKREVFYKRTGIKEKAVKLCSWNDIFSKLEKHKNVSVDSLYAIYVDVSPGKVNFVTSIMSDLGNSDDFDDIYMYESLVSVSAKGGSPKVICEGSANDGIRMMSINNKMQYKVLKGEYNLSI
ncbi:MAG: hypothetical protein ACI4HL_05985 [Ruminococcus sp.]